MRFDLSALTTGSLTSELHPLVERERPLVKSAMSAEAVEAARSSVQSRQPVGAAGLGPHKMPQPTGGAALYTNESETDYDASLAVTWTLCVKSCCLSQSSQRWEIADRFTRFLYMMALTLCVVACIIALQFQRTMFIPKNVSWFGWLVFIVFVVSEFILMLARMVIGRCRNIIERPERADNQDAQDMVRMIITYESFNDGLQMWVVILLQLFSSAAFIAGSLFMVMQMDILFEDEVNNTVLTKDLRVWWRAGWSVAFALMTIGVCAAGWLDASRLSQVQHDAPHFHIELIAVRVLLLTLAVPILHIAYIVYCAVCCEGDLIFG